MRSERLEHGESRILGDNGLGELMLYAVIRRRKARRGRLFDMTQCIVEREDHACTKTRGELGTVARCDLLHGFETRTTEGVCRNRVEVQSFNGKRRHKVSFFAARCNGAIAVAG